MAIQQDSSSPTGVADTSPHGSGPGARAAERKAAAALELKKRNYSWSDIAETLGFPTARAALVATERVLEAGLLSPESQEFMRQLASSRLEELLYAIRDKALDDENPDQLAAIARSRELIESHAKINGYAAPQRVAVYNPLESEINEFVAATLAAKQSDKTLVESDIFADAPDDGDVHTITTVTHPVIPGKVESDPRPEPEPLDDKEMF